MPNQLIRRLAALAPTLRPEGLQRVIDEHGLEDCAELVAQATPAQISHLFDLDLWRAPSPGRDEQFDPARFGLWLEVLADAGPEVAAEKVAGMPLPQIVAGLGHHVRVFDVSAVSSYETTDGARLDYSRPVRDLIGCEIGGYHVAAIRDDAWDAIVNILVALDQHHPGAFVALMRGVRSRSHSRREQDGSHALLGNTEQMVFDVADERQRRREERGFVSPADARAFLQLARSIALDPASPRNPTAPGPIGTTGLVPAGEPATAIERCLRVVGERDPEAFAERMTELASLANVLKSGSTIQGRPFTAKEAADAAVAICNLGLTRLPDFAGDVLLRRNLTGVFQRGWQTLYLEACLPTARALAVMLAKRRSRDGETQRALNVLRVRLLRAVEEGTPWIAADALDVLTGVDLPAWAALVGLIAECPVVHAGLVASLDRRIRSVDSNAFTFISGTPQLASVRAFVDAMPEVLWRDYHAAPRAVSASRTPTPHRGKATAPRRHKDTK